MDCYKCINGLYDEDCLTEPETCQEGQVNTTISETCYGLCLRVDTLVTALNIMPLFLRMIHV